MAGRIIVINPNSSEAVTAAIETAVAPLRIPGGPGIECVTLAEGPPGIESQRDADAVIEPLCRYVGRRDREAGAFVIACYSDPGVAALREISTRPVLGIGECGVLTALTRGERFGVIAILERSIPRHLRYLRALGLEQRLAGEVAIGLGIGELGDPDRLLERLVEAGTRLRGDHHADVIVLGCAGMARQRPALEAALGLAVVEPTQAAVTMAIGAVCLAGGERNDESPAPPSGSDR